MSTTKTVPLDTPIKRGEKTITKVEVRKPNSGALRGTKLMDLMQMDVAALTIVLPRITDPTLTTNDVNEMDPADLFSLGAAVSGFLLTKAEKKEAGEAEQTSQIP